MFIILDTAITICGENGYNGIHQEIRIYYLVRVIIMTLEGISPEVTVKGFKNAILRIQYSELDDMLWNGDVRKNKALTSKMETAILIGTFRVLNV